jgi:hypothetical protein
MKHYTLILTLLATTVAVGCGRNQPTTTPTNREPSRPPDSSDAQPSTPDGVPSVKDRGVVSRPDRSSETEIVQTDVRRILNAVYQGDVDTVVGYTHPKIIELMGGITQTKSLLRTALSKTQGTRMTLESLTFPVDPTFLKTDLNHFVIVPTKSVVRANGQRLESLNYQVGIRAVGTSKWTYIEGSRINKQNVRTLFPDFPSDYEFPGFYRKRL